MSRIESIEDAVSFLKGKGYFVHIVYFGGRKFYQVSDCKQAIMKHRPNVTGPSFKWSQGHFEDGRYWTNYTPQSLVCYAKGWFGNNYNSIPKEFRHKKNRAKTKELIYQENFDNFGPKSLAKDVDSWYYD